MLETSQDPNLSMSTASTSPPSLSGPNPPQPPHDFLSMMAPAAPEDDGGVDSSVAVGPLSLGSALSNQQVRQLSLDIDPAIAMNPINPAIAMNPILLRAH